MPALRRRMLFHQQPVANSARRLQVHRVRRIGLDLAAQPVDLDVDGPLAATVRNFQELVPLDGLAGTGCEHAQELALSFGDTHRLVATLELAALEVEGERAEADHLDRWHLRLDGAPQD